ncbi:ketosteroid isomerase family protein [Nocardia sp. NPDC052566]|uniref:ketosteroid isomerase family protein n=1 Tax=Nocardia sp. NPDC052566 TaxID=3364330 RepID=UPI0037C8576F
MGCPGAGYTVDTIDVRADTDASAHIRVTGKLVWDGTPEACPFETSFMLNRPSANGAYVIADQTFHGIQVAAGPMTARR